MPHGLDFDDPFFPVPSAAVDADPAAAMRELFYRVARLEQAVEEQRAQAVSDLADVLLTHVTLSDDLGRIAERIGIPTNAQQAMLARSVAALGQKVMAILRHHEVAPIEVLGRPVDASHSDVVGEEVRADLPAGTVVREEQVGYRWRHGVLRRAKVVVSATTGEDASGAESPRGPDGAKAGGG